MNKTFLVSMALALLAAPLAYAHDPAGTPKNYCEPPGEWSVHDYGPVASGNFNFVPVDGNSGDCDGGGLTPPDPTNFVCVDVSPSLIYVHFCEEYGLPAGDFDGHAEFAQGGAFILVESGSGAPSADPNVGAGTLYCYGGEGHHPAYGPVSVVDLALGAGGAWYSVGSDMVDLSGLGGGCGDGLIDLSHGCVADCTITFLPGLDGSYHVIVQGSQGHIIW